MSYLLFFQASTHQPRTEEPLPEGGEREGGGDEQDEELDDEPDTVRVPIVEEPATPDANPIDPRVFSHPQ